MESSVLDRNIATHALHCPDDPPTLSVACHPEWDVETTLREATFILNAQVRVSTVGEIRALGHEVEPLGRPPHASLKFGAEPSEEVYDVLRDAFSAPRSRQGTGDD